jgi:macrolide phosphotransferase
MSIIDEVLDLARSHGLSVSSEDATLIEAGLDYRVVITDDANGQRWILRQPRRDDVAEKIANEASILQLVGPVLAKENIAVPDWRVHGADLIAYPALPGSPGLTLSSSGEPIWHMDPASPDYAARLGRLLASLHGITAAQASVAGVETRSPEQVRQAWRDDIDKVRDGFSVSPAFVESWQAWLSDDTCWPEETVMTHGEIYPAHVLMSPDGVITGVLDWTTARADDPARDFAAQYGAAGQDMLEAALDAYEEADGPVYPGMAAQARHLWDAAPIGHGLYALTTRDEQDMATAAAMLGGDS